MKELFYFGSYSDSIFIGKFENKKLNIINKILCLKNPSYLSVNKDVLYTVSETETGGIASYKILDGRDQLEQLNFQSINQSLPCYISTNIDRTKLIVANYGSGSICMYEILSDGTIGNSLYSKTYVNSHMHFAEFVDNCIYGIDLGNDTLNIYSEDMSSNFELKLDKNSGPRHAVILNDYIYIVTELSNQLLVYKKDTLELVQKISTVKNQELESYAGAIIISNDHKYIYVTNRGENTISVFSIVDSKLKMIQNISSFGDFPRDIVFNTTEEYAFVANQKSNNISLFKRDVSTGILTKIEENAIFINSPSCIVRSN